MNFEEKITSFFSDYRLKFINRYPRHYEYIYADYIELIALFANDNYITADEFLDRLEEEKNIDLRFLKHTNDEDISEEENQKDDDRDRAELNDEKQKFSESIFRFLTERKEMFGNEYPFIVKFNRIKLKKSISKKSKIYIGLLLCSSLDIFKLFKHDLSSEFEEISKEALINFLPPHAKVKSLGKRPDYTGYAKEKIRLLADDIKINIKQEAFSQISEANRQEKGLDLIGWIPFDDRVPNILCILCQCTCKKEWNDKLAESLRYNRYYDFHVNKPIAALFIPYNIITPNEKHFIRNDDITNDTLMFDRKRILNYINDCNFFSSLDTFKLVDKCIKYEEPLI